jgi:glycosyltransferase involved in cell wall biosynthesis
VTTEPAGTPGLDTGEVLVVVPAYNERACIAAVVADVLAAGHACLVVDDGSTDDTAALARAAGARVVCLPINLGVGGALRTGFRYACDHGYRTVVQVDADGQHPTATIDALVQALDERDLDMVVGSRFLQPSGYQLSRSRRAAIALLARVIATAGDTRTTDPTSGLRAIRTPLLDALAHNFPHHYLGDTFEALLVATRRGYRIGEVPVAMRPRQGGQPSAGHYASFRAMVRACTVLLTGTSFDLPPRPSAAGTGANR